MQGMSERDYAARAGLSRGAIQKAKLAGRLVLHADGSIDPDASDARRHHLDAHHERRREEHSPQEPEAELRAGLGVGRDAGRIVVRGAGDETWAQALEQVAAETVHRAAANGGGARV